MSDRVNAEKAVRKAIETALNGLQADLRMAVPVALRPGDTYGTDQAPVFPIWWPNQPFYSEPEQSRPPFFLRFSHHPSPPRPRTMGPTPRVLLRGHSLIGCFVPEGAGEDLADNLANVVLSAYPYSATFTRDGFEVYVDNPDPKPALGALGRWYKPVHINWSCWRTTP